MKVDKAVREKIEPLVSAMGYEIVDVEFVKKGADDNLTVYIDIPSGVSLDDCEKVHNAIDPLLDEHPGLIGRLFASAISSVITARKWKSSFTLRLRAKKFMKACL